MRATTLKILSVSPADRSLVVEWNGDPGTRWVCGVPARFDQASMRSDLVVSALVQACFDQLVAEEADTSVDWSALNGLVGRELDASAALEEQIRQRRQLGRRRLGWRAGSKATPITPDPTTAGPGHDPSRSTA